MPIKKKVLLGIVVIMLGFVCIGKAEVSPYDKREKVYFGATSPSVYYRGQLNLEDYTICGFSEKTTSEEVHLLWDCIFL